MRPLFHFFSMRADDEGLAVASLTIRLHSLKFNVIIKIKSHKTKKDS